PRAGRGGGRRWLGGCRWLGGRRNAPAGYQGTGGRGDGQHGYEPVLVHDKSSLDLGVGGSGCLAPANLPAERPGGPGVPGGGEASGGDVVDVAGDAHRRVQQRRAEQPLDVFRDGDVRVGDRGRLQRRLGDPGGRGGLSAKPGVGQEAGGALGVLDDGDLKAAGGEGLPTEQLPGEVGEVGDVLDDGLGDPAAGVADDDGVAELEPEDDPRVGPVVQAAEDEQLRGGRAERRGGVAGGELLVAVEQRGYPGHDGPVPFRGGYQERAGAEVPTPCRSAMSRIAAASRSGCSAVVRWPPGKVRIVAWGT